MNILEQTLSDLQQYKRPKQQLLEYYIQKRLTESLKTYYHDINESARYLADKDQYRVAKKLSKEL